MFSYRVTPHSSTDITPANAMVGWNFRSGLPVNNPGILLDALKANIKTKQLNWNNGTKRRPRLQLGDKVMVKNIHGKFDGPHELVQKLGPYSFQLDDGRKRNCRSLAKC